MTDIIESNILCLNVWISKRHTVSPFSTHRAQLEALPAELHAQAAAELAAERERGEAAAAAAAAAGAEVGAEAAAAASAFRCRAHKVSVCRPSV